MVYQSHWLKLTIFIFWIIFYIKYQNFFSNIYIISGYRGRFIKNKYHNKTINLTQLKLFRKKNLKEQVEHYLKLKNSSKMIFS